VNTEQSLDRPSDDAPGRGDEADQGDDQSGGIHFHFPIDIRLVGGSDDDLVDQVVERVFDELRRELERRG
jgi:hypothetical protein